MGNGHPYGIFEPDILKYLVNLGLSEVLHCVCDPGLFACLVLHLKCECQSKCVFNVVLWAYKYSGIEISYVTKKVRQCE